MSQKPVRRDELSEVFRAFESSPETFRIGAENEKFGVSRVTGRPLSYGGDFSVCQVLRHLEANHGWSPIVEKEDGPVLGLRRGEANITLEPGAQLELSGEPLPDLHAVHREKQNHLREIAPVSQELGISWLTTGFHPTSRLDELPWVPKERYPLMRAYLPQKGSGALDMMQRTATVQGNFDWSSERDGMRKLLVSLKLSPLVHAWFANAPFREGKPAGTLSARGHVWRHMDPTRSGLIPSLWQKDQPTYDDYVEWSLDAGMFLFKRESEYIKNTGQTFRDFLDHGYQGHRATLNDYRLHLQTLFPEVRLKNTLEVRSCDSLPPALAMAALAVWTGVLYDEQALGQAEALVERFDFARLELERPALIDSGLSAPLMGRTGFDWAMAIAEIAKSGLERRGRLDAAGQSEAVFLAPAFEIVEARRVPAERCLERFMKTDSVVEATRIELSA